MTGVSPTIESFMLPIAPVSVIAPFAAWSESKAPPSWMVKSILVLSPTVSILVARLTQFPALFSLHLFWQVLFLHI
jgi:hypothetical protein